MRLRWVVLGVFVVSSALNYLDRQILPALQPAIRSEFGLSNSQYGAILSAFSAPYAIAAPLAGLFIDRAGLVRGISLAVGLWSSAGILTGLARSFLTFCGCRGLLGMAEAGGVPATGKAIATYLKPEERALGNAVSQAGLGIGGIMAPPLAIWFAVNYNWRYAFVATGLAGLLWIPLWAWASRLAAPLEFKAVRAPGGSRDVLRDRAMWSFIAANMLAMTTYTLWTNWVTAFLVEERGLSLAATARYAWIPPVFFNLGGLAGGALSLAWMRGGTAAIAARMRAVLIAALALVATAATPFLPGAALATAGICFSAFWSSALSVNLYTMPLDLFGSARAAFSVSLLTGAYGVMQAGFSPGAGALIDRFGFTPVCVGVAVLPLFGFAVLKAGLREA